MGGPSHAVGTEAGVRRRLDPRLVVLVVIASLTAIAFVCLGAGVSMQRATPPATEAAVFVLTALQYLSLLVFAGLVFFELAVLGVELRREPGGRMLLRGSWICAALTSALLICVSALRIVGRDLSAAPAVGSWLPGVQWPPVAVAALVIGGGGAALLFRSRTRGRAMAAVLCAGIAVAAPALVGHSRTAGPGWLAIAADLGHLFAGAIWTGGLIGLARFLANARAARLGGGGAVPPELATRIVIRYSGFALVSVIVLGVSGTTMALVIVDSWEALLATAYGRALLLKTGVVASAVAIAAWNRTRLLPRIVAFRTAGAQWLTLYRTLRYEAMLLAVVIVVTAFLGNADPSHGQLR